MENKKKDKSGHIPLRIEPELHEQIAQRAQEEKRSINKYIARLLEKDVQKHNFEDRQFVGTVIPGKDINQTNGLVKVAGIYYRYLIDGNQPLKSESHYAIIEANGNVLTLREI